MLVIPCGVFYDDFPMFSPEELATNADSSASELLDILGWRHARTGPKGKPFESKFQVLGCSLDLAGVATGEVVAENRPGRIDRLLEHLRKIRAANSISLHEAQVLHGLLRYACGFFAGRHLHQVCAEVMSFGTAASKGGRRNLSDFCDYASQALKDCKPRVLSAGWELRPILIFTDGCWESGFAGLGAVIVDTADNSRWVWSGQVPGCLLDKWKSLVGEQLICQIELYAMVAIRWSFANLFRNRRTLWWVDNDAARFATIKGLSPSLVMRFLVRMFYHFEVTAPTFSWIERIPSHSNPSDGPSRGKPEEAMRLLDVQGNGAVKADDDEQADGGRRKQCEGETKFRICGCPEDVNGVSECGDGEVSECDDEVVSDCEEQTSWLQHNVTELVNVWIAKMEWSGGHEVVEGVMERQEGQRWAVVLKQERKVEKEVESVPV
eukprot:s4108_g1.t1